MTYDELERLVLGKDVWALQRALAPLDQRARAKLSAPTRKLYRQLSKTEAGPGASYRLRFFLSLRQKGVNHRNSLQNRHARLALFAVGPLSAVTESDFDIAADHIPVFDQIVRDRRPDWLDDWVADQLESELGYLRFPLLRAWIRDGICAKPIVDGYYRSFAGQMIWPRGYRPTAPVPSITAQLLADPALLSDIEGLFRVRNLAFSDWPKNGIAPDRQTWPEALIALAAEGHLDRSALMQSALNGLFRDLGQDQLAGMCAFYRRMEPTAAELRRDQYGYVDLLCHPASYVVKFALEMLGIVEKQDVLDPAPVLREVPVVFTRDGKGNAIVALQLLKRILGRDGYAAKALKAVGEALRHAHPDVQSLALDILDAHSSDIAPEDFRGLKGMEAFVAASSRAQLAQLLGETGAFVRANALPDYRPLTPDRIEAPILRAEDAIPPIDTVEALIAAVLHAVETVDSPDEVERIVDGISRLGATRPATFRAQMAPLLHRIRTVGGTNGIAVGGAGAAGALRNLICVWAKGKRRWRARSEPTYGLPKTAFAPMTAHIRAVARRIQRGESRSLLSAPTHRGGWIDPVIWVERLQLNDRSVIDSVDFRLSLLRLAPDRQEVARQHANTLPKPLREIVNFALGGEAMPIGTERGHYAAWITAARARDPYRDWREELASLDLDDPFPDGIRPARYSWRISPSSRAPTGVPEVVVTVNCNSEGESIAADRSGSWVRRMKAALAWNSATDWRRLPTVALTRPLERNRHWFHAVSAPWAEQWLSCVWPQNPTAFYMHGVASLAPGIDRTSDRHWPSHGYFHPLFQRGRPWGELGHLLLCVGLVSKDADARGLAIDALIEGIDGRMFDPVSFASTIAQLTDGHWVKLNRLGDALKAAMQVSTLHAAVVGEAVQRWLPKLDLGQRNAFQILEVLVETQAATGRPLLDAGRTALGCAAGSTKAARIARMLIQ